VAYVKLTTHAYVTKCGVSYHGIGIEPHIAVELSEEAKQYSIYLLPENIDNQLQTAISAVKS
jgi:C-terminal processing protease CtpA/Prc